MIPADSKIIETTAETFVADVLERSQSVPVVVDFWAEWCQPCRILGPILEKLANEFEGQFVLVKADTEKLGDIASSFGVRSIPAVFAVKAGKVVDSFVGVLPESALRSWIERILPTPAETLAIEARHLEATDPQSALTRYHEVLALAPHDPVAKIGLARVYLGLEKLDESRSILNELEKRGFLEPEAEMLKAELTLHGKAGVASIENLRTAHLTNPKDNPTQLGLAEALASSGKFDEALPLALELVERDRKGTGESARKLMIAAFQLLPADSELANSYRRKLSVAL